MPRKKHSKPPTAAEPANDPAEVVYTVTQVAQRWKVSRRTITEMINTGRLAGFRVIGHFRIRAVDVVEYETRNSIARAS